MVSHWIDVNAGDWYYNDIAEASAVKLEDGEPWITGIPYNDFWSDAPFLYQEFKGDGSTKVFTLSKKIIPTKANPLFVYVDGAQTVYDKTDNSGETTVVTLIAAPSKGAIVSFAIYGKPAIDQFMRPKGIVETPFTLYGPLPKQIAIITIPSAEGIRNTSMLLVDSCVGPRCLMVIGKLCRSRKWRGSG